MVKLKEIYKAINEKSENHKYLLNKKMKKENNNTNKNINQQRSAAKNAHVHRKELLETLLQEGEVLIGDYKISLKKLETSEINNDVKNKEDLPNLIKSYDKRILECLPEEALHLVEEYKNKNFELFKVNCFVFTDESSGYEKLLNNYLHINFSSLKYLGLENCNLQNIESISFINAPFLEFLQLSKNNLSNMNALIKSYFPQLTQFIIDDNYIQETEKLSRFNSNELIRFEIEFSFRKMELIEDARFLLKLNYELQPKVIYLFNPNRNTQLIRSIVTKLNRKGNEIRLNNSETIKF